MGQSLLERKNEEGSEYRNERITEKYHSSGHPKFL